jgi:hypothetical protein
VRRSKLLGLQQQLVCQQKLLHCEQRLAHGVNERLQQRFPQMLLVEQESELKLAQGI